MTFPRLIFLAALACLACLFPTVHVSTAQAAPIRTVTLGDPAHPEALVSALQDAYAGGARRIVIRPGAYTLPMPLPACHLHGSARWDGSRFARSENLCRKVKPR